jgi:hypothetical protein
MSSKEKRVKIQLYTETVAVLLPTPWRDAVEDRPHVQQGRMFIFAPTKAEAERMLEARRPGAGRLIREMRLYRPPYSLRTVRVLLEAGLIDPEMPGVYVEPLDSGNGDRIARIEPDGTTTIVGVLRFDTRYQAERREWAEPV